MARFSKTWYWLVIIAVLILVAGTTTLFPQTNDVSVSEETKSLDTTNKIETTPKVQPRDPTSPSTMENVDPATKVELQRLFNELRTEYLDARAKSVDWWLGFITIVLTFFAVIIPIAIAIVSYIGRNRFRELESDAKKYVDEIKEHRAQSEAELRKRTSQDFNNPNKAKEVEKDIRDVQSDPDPSLIDRTIADIYDLQSRGRIEDAIEKWRSIANIAEGIDIDLVARSWFSVGYLYAEKDRNEESLSAYDKAIHFKPDFVNAYNNRGLVKVELELYESAVDDYNEAIRLKPNRAEIYYNRGFAMMRLGQHESAINDYNEAIRLKPNDAETYNNRGLVKVELGQHESAVDDYNKAIRLKPNDAETYNNRGLVKVELELYESAVDDYNKAIRLKPDFAVAYNNRGSAKSEMGRHRLAVDDCNEAIRLKPDFAEAYDSRGNAKRALGQHKSAIDDYNKAIHLKSDDAEFYYNRGNVHVDMKHIEDAKADFQTALELTEQPGEADLKMNIEKRLQELNGT